ncbi:hypothetical protein N9850_04085 [Granulosicoccus sp.]|nr:hypothetical protein [Granulosicoccus sp.]MDB4222928.1 hypothetical protein [Granulosicoccus sp.]
MKILDMRILVVVAALYSSMVAAEGIFFYKLGSDTYAGTVEMGSLGQVNNWFLITCDGTSIPLSEGANLSFSKQSKCIQQNQPVAIVANRASASALSVIPTPSSPCGDGEISRDGLSRYGQEIGMNNSFRQAQLADVFKMWADVTAPAEQVQWSGKSISMAASGTQQIYGMAANQLYAQVGDPCGGGNPTNCPNCRKDIDSILIRLPEWGDRFVDPKRHDDLMNGISAEISGINGEANIWDIRAFADSHMRSQATEQIFRD